MPPCGTLERSHLVHAARPECEIGIEANVELVDQSCECAEARRRRAWLIRPTTINTTPAATPTGGMIDRDGG